MVLGVLICLGSLLILRYDIEMVEEDALKQYQNKLASYIVKVFYIN